MGHNAPTTERTLAKPPPVEMELLRLLHHARGCDRPATCALCRLIDLRLGDWPHGTEDPAKRLDLVDQALVACARQAERLYQVLEGSSVPASTRSVAAQLMQWLGKTRELLAQPITAGDAQHVRPPRVRTAVVFRIDHGWVVHRGGRG